VSLGAPGGSAAKPTAATGALAGLRVVDLSRVLAGPICGMTLGDHGADVIKVEPPALDDTRQWGPPFAGASVPGAPEGYRGESAYYLFCNRNKRGIVLDLARAEGREILLRLTDGADVVIENFKLGTLEKWGLGYDEVLSRRNPRLILASISGFGATGPYAHLPGYDVLGQAMGGMMSVTGLPGSGPTRVGVAIADITSGMYAIQGVLLALASRERTGRGQRVDLSLLESTVSLLTHLASNYLVGGMAPMQYGNSHPSIVPYRMFTTADSYVYVAVGNDRQFQVFTREIGLPELGTDPRFATNPARATNRTQLEPLLEAAIAKRTTADWIDRFWKAGVASSPVADLTEVFANPQVLHREMVLTTDHPTIGDGVRMTGIPVKMRGTPGAVRRHPPLAGEHTREVLREAGYSDAEADGFLARGVTKEWGKP